MSAATGTASSLELLGALVERQLRLRSKRSVLGVAWPLVAPLLLLALYGFVFGSVFDVAVEDYGVFLFAGLLPWTFLVQAVNDGLQSISFEPELVRRARFAYELLPLSRVAVMAVPFLVLLAGFVATAVVVRDVPLRLLALLPLPVVAIAAMTSALTILLALVDVHNRDVRLVLGNVLTVWFFLTPIVYGRDMAGPALRALAWVDPVHMVVVSMRDLLYEGRVEHPAQLALAPVVGVALLVAVLALFRRAGPELPKAV